MSCWYFAIIASVIVLLTVTVSTKRYVVYCLFICVMSLFHGHVACRQIAATIWLTSAAAY